MSRKKVFLVFLILFFCLFSSLVLIPLFMGKERILKLISEKTGYRIELKDIGLGISKGLAIRLDDIRIRSADFSVSAKKVFVLYRIFPVLKGNFVPRKIIAERVDFFAKRSLFEKKGKKGRLKLPSIYVKDGRFSIFGIRPCLKKIDLSLEKKEDEYSLRCNASLFVKKETPIEVEGKISRESRFKVSILEFPLEDLKKSINGKVWFYAEVILSDKKIVSSGKIRLKELSFILKKRRYDFRRLDLTFRSNYTKKTLFVSPLIIKGDGFKLNIDSQYRYPSYIKISLRSSDFIEYRKIKRFIPSVWAKKIKDGRIKIVFLSTEGNPEILKDNLSAFILIDRASAVLKEGLFPIRSIRAKIFFKKNHLEIKDLSARFSSSYIQNASFKRSGKDIDLSLKGFFFIEDILSYRQLFPERIKNLPLKGKGKVCALIRCRIRDSIDISGSSIFLKRCTFSYKNSPFFIDEGRFWADKNHIFGKIKSRSSFIYLDAIPYSFNNIKINLSGNICSDIFEPIKESLFEMKLVLKRERDLKICGNLFLKRLKLKSHSFTIKPSNFRFLISYMPERITLEKLIFRSERSSARMYLRLSGKKAYLKFYTKGIFLNDFGISSSKKAAIRADLKAYYPEDLIYGRIRFSDLEISFLENLTGYINFKGKLAKFFFKTNLWDSSVRIKGRMKGWKKGEIFLDSDYLDFSKIRLPLTKNKKKGKVKNIDLKISLKIKKAVYKRISFSPIMAKLRFKDGMLQIEDITADLSSGNIKAAGQLSEKKVSFDLKLFLKKIPLEDILFCFSSERYATGNLMLNSHIYAQGTLKDFISKMKGDVKILITDGKIYKNQFILKILNFLSLSNILKLNLKGLIEEGVPFKKISAKAMIKDGEISFKNMILESNAINAAAKGKVSFLKKELNLKVAIQPFGTVDSVIGKIPVVGYIIGGKDKRISFYYLEIKGPFDDIHVEQKPLENLAKGTLNFFKRILLTPSHMLENIK